MSRQSELQEAKGSVLQSSIVKAMCVTTQVPVSQLAKLLQQASQCFKGLFK